MNALSVRTITWIAVAWACLFALGACGGNTADAESKTAPAVKITYPKAEPGTITAVGIESYFRVTQESNPSTGFRWLFKVPPDEGFIKIIEDRYEEPTGDKVGAAGTKVWLLQAVGVGETEFTIEYIRPWEDDAEPEKTATYKIVIKDKAQSEESPE